MFLDNPELQKQMAEETKQKWEKLVFGDKPYKCIKCWELKDPKDFVIQRLDNYRVGKYRYLYECKECKKNRIYKKRDKDRETIQWALNIIIKQLQQWAKNRKIDFNISPIRRDLRISDPYPRAGQFSLQIYYITLIF